jgi:hypothetical protein
MGAMVSMDFFTVSTLTGRVLFVLVLLSHERRRVVHVNVTEHPTSIWTAQQVVEAFPDNSAPRWLLRDRDSIYGDVFRRRVAGMGITEVVFSPMSPGQSPYVERLIGSIRRECLDHVIVINGHISAKFFARTSPITIGAVCISGWTRTPLMGGRSAYRQAGSSPHRKWAVFITDTSGARHSFSGAIAASPDCWRRVARDCHWCVADVRLADRLALMPAWRMLRDSQLSEATHRANGIRPATRSMFLRRDNWCPRSSRKADNCEPERHFGERQVAMPPQDRLGLHDHQGGTPVPPSLGEENPEESVSPAELWPFDRSGQRDQLLPEREILERDSPVSPAEQSDRSEEYDQRRQHS